MLKIRCSAISKIMPGKRKDWLKGTEDYLRELWVQERYGRRKEISSKYMTKGTVVEEDSITLLSAVHRKFYEKNEEYFENDFITGTPDIVKPDLRDIKSSWNIFTFHKTKEEGITDDNYWQMQGYMALTGAKVAHVDYCLVDTPEQLVRYEKNRILYNPDTDDSEWYWKKCKKVEKNLTYGDIAKGERVESFKVERDEENINLIYERVVKCRDWMNKHLPKP